MAPKPVKVLDDTAFLRAIAAHRINLLLTQPFFGTLAMYMPVVLIRDSNKCLVAATDGHTIFLNPDNMQREHASTWGGIILHEVLHAALGHMGRMEHRNADRWNIACDILVNGMLDADAIQLPKWVTRRPSLAHLSAEEIYRRLRNDGDDDDGSDSDIDPRRRDLVPNNDVSEQDLKTIWAERLVSAGEAAKRAGKLSNCQDRLVTDAVTAVVDWRNALTRFLTPTSSTIDNWGYPSRRSIPCGYYRPSRLLEATAQIIIIVIDTSASVTVAELTQFQGEVASIQRMFRPDEIRVYYVDSEIQNVQSFGPDDHLKFEAKGGGGTSFSPAFLDIAQKNDKPQCLVYLTDGDASFSNIPTPDYPVLWAITDPDFKDTPQFGEVVKVKMDTYSNPTR